MCGGIEYKDGSRILRIYFPNPKAALPVRRKSGDVTWLPWGRRETETVPMPQGGWAQLESIQAGKWEKYQPRPVLIPALRFMEKDDHRVSHWFEVPALEMIQGLVASVSDDSRVYVVTVQTPLEFPHIHDRWPRLVTRKSPPSLAPTKNP